MSRFALTLFALLAIFAITFADQCGPGEEFKTCGSSCSPTCEQPNRVCSEVCVLGCQCKDGLVRNGAGRCISPRNC